MGLVQQHGMTCLCLTGLCFGAWDNHDTTKAPPSS